MSQDSLKEYVESQAYFRDARNWYNLKYLAPLSHKVWLVYATLLLVIVMGALAVNIYKLLPVKQELIYAISVSTRGENNARIVSMDAVGEKNSPQRFIAKNLLEDYVANRENYNYDNLEGQFNRVHNDSTRLVFKRFYNYMSINNPDSPIMRYQKYAKRKIAITDIKFISDNAAIVHFHSTAKDDNNSIFENLNWEARVSFEMGDVGKRKPTGSPFDFTVIDYSLKLLEDQK